MLPVHHFRQRAQSLTGSRAAPARTTLEALARYHWPGNVRQLASVVAALVVRGPPERGGGAGPLPAAITGGSSGPDGMPTLHEARQVFERRFVSGALAQAGGRRAKAASALRRRSALGRTRRGRSRRRRPRGLRTCSKYMPASSGSRASRTTATTDDDASTGCPVPGQRGRREHEARQRARAERLGP